MENAVDEEMEDFDFVSGHWYRFVCSMFNSEEKQREIFSRGLEIIYLTDDRRYYLNNGWPVLLRELEGK